MAQTLTDALAWWARMQPDAPAVVLNGESLTYGDFKAWSDRVANYLITKGIKPGDRVGICALNSLAYCALIMGTIRAGGIVAPINFRFTVREITDLTSTTEPAVVFAGPEFVENTTAAGLNVHPIAEIEVLKDGANAGVAHDIDPDAPVVIIATSGSTAKPKGVVFSHRTMTSYVGNWAVEGPGSTVGSRIISLAPLNTSAGFVQLIHYLVQGCTIYMQPQFVPSEVLKLIVDEQISCFGAVPVFFEAIAALPEFADADLSSLKLVTCGGARVSPRLLNIYKDKGVTIRQIYGQTEVGGNATMMPEHLAMSEPDKCGWGGVFIELRVVRPDGTDCDPGEHGEIIMRSPGMMVGYWRNEAETAKALRDGWLYSGDIGTLDNRGLLTYVDRMKDLIISGGLNISAAEVEAVISEYPGVTEVLVIAAPCDKFGETPMAIYHGTAEIDVEGLIRHCNDNLSNFKVPRYVIFSAEPLPRLATGKLSKPAVRERYAEAHKTLQRVR